MAISVAIRDLDTPYHEDHVRDNALNAGCNRCAPFFEHPDPWGSVWQKHRANLGFMRSVVHTYKGEGLTTCGLEVVGPCPDCARANGERT